ncbi:uncharacterized protein (TIGR00156 family) [Orbus hercynius]|uniref:Uncharacterized protein (TIGR00156 family) n=1 Tax=Orbus hercynius TaxID=593135 RepID=A0A495RIJ1_9GAMM|nr:NirD/YgiW/YdeI family stress tolerance protein [Orbus hercynius]RKS87352.1 uncharacterized protein (TIGR00156 family) [Orbus hercynius]
MKKLIPLVLITTLGISGTALAKHDNRGGFSDGMMMSPGSGGMGMAGGLVSATTVEQVKQLADDSFVVLKGHIIQQVGKKEYIFKDDTGQIQVEIGNRDWRGQVVSPTDLVEISGKVDKDWNSVEIDVKSLRIITAAVPAPANSK